MEEEILDIKRENYRLLKENFDLVRDNVRLQEENKIFERKLREKLCMEAHSQFKELQENSIPKSKIKDKIEELEKEKTETYTQFLGLRRNNDSLSTKGKMIEGGIQVLQELLDDTKKEDN